MSSRLVERGLPRPRRQAADEADQWRVAPNPAWRPPSPAEQTAAGSHDVEASPYRGLAFYRPEDAGYFFGRESLTGDLLDRLGTHRGPLIVTGASGAGKSSLLRAGLIPAVERMDLPAPRRARWSWRVTTPAADPFGPLALWLSALVDLPVGELRDRLASDPQELSAVLRRVRARTGERVLLVVDQFEELFTVCRSEPVREAFVRTLAAASGDAAVVLGLRAGYFGHCARYPELVVALERPLVVVPLSQAGLREVIEKPASKAGLVLEHGLADRLLADLGDAPTAAGSLPLLSHALLVTWQRRDGNRLTLAGYQATGGIQRALAQSADAFLDRLDASQRDAARRMLVRLVRIGDGTEDIRRRLPLSEVIEDHESAGVLDSLVRARLVSIDQETAELAHDALLRAWPQLRSWIAADRAGLLVRQQLAEAAVNWARHDRDPAFLYAGSRLAEVDAWLREDPERARVGPTERVFLAAARHQRRRDSLRRRRGVALLAVALVLALAAAGYATWQQRIAARNEAVAEASRNGALALATAYTAERLRGSNPALAMQLGVAAFGTAATAEARSALLSAVSIPVTTTLSGHTNAVDAVAFDPAGRVLATGSEDGTVRLWDIATDPRHPQELSTLDEHTGLVYDVAFSADGKVLASASEDRTVILTDVSTPDEPRLLTVLRDHVGAVRGVATSRAGRLLATASADGRAMLWDIGDARAPKRLSILGEHRDTVRSASFSPDGRILATASADRTAILWDISDPGNPKRLSTLAGHADTVRAVPFSPDGKLIATASNDRTAKLWDVANPAAPKELSTLGGHAGTVRWVAFSPNQPVLVTASEDRTARLWDIGTPASPVLAAVLAGHTSTVAGAAFAPGGGTLATASVDQTAKLWDVSDPRNPATLLPSLGEHTATVRGVAFAPDGRTLATASEDRTARLWDVGDPGRRAPLSQLTGHGGIVNGVAFNPRRPVAATFSDDGTVILWDVRDPAKPVRLSTLAVTVNTVKGAVFGPDGVTLVTVSGDQHLRVWNVRYEGQPEAVGAPFKAHDSYIFGVAIAPDGRTLATVSEDRTARIWDIRDPRNPILLSTLDGLRGGHVAPLFAVAFNHDGTMLATAAEDRTAKLWDVTTAREPRLLRTLEGHGGPVRGVAFSQQGRLVATASGDGTAKLWDISDPGHARIHATLTGHTNLVAGVALTNDGRVLATASWDGTARLWLTDAGAVQGLVCDAVSKPPTDTEWARVLPDVPYRIPCPSR